MHKKYLLSLILSWLSVFFLDIPALAVGENLQELIFKAKQAYQQEQYQQAAQLFEEAAAVFATQEDRLNQAITLTNLSLAYQEIGAWKQAQAALDKCLEILNKIEQTSQQQLILAQAWSSQGKLERELGKSEAALESWQKASQIYDELNYQEAFIQSQINRAQTWQDLGIYSRACKTLLEVLAVREKQCYLSREVKEIIQQKSLSKAEKNALIGLANVWRARGDFKAAEVVLASILQQKLSPLLRVTALMNLAHTQRAIATEAQQLKKSKKARDYRQKALDTYQQATQEKFPSKLLLQIQINQLSLLIENSQWQSAQDIFFPIQELLVKLPPSRSTIYGQINLAINLVCLQLKRVNCLQPLSENDLDNGDHQQVIKLLKTAITNSKNINDQRSLSSALGNLGLIYEKSNNYPLAREYTQQALQAAQQAKADDFSYQWYWQLGRLHKDKDRKIANIYYQQAFNILKNLRGDLVALNKEIRFSFQERIEPVYREYLDLLLTKEVPEQANLQQARKVIEALQLAELDNFFRDACLKSKPVDLDKLDPKAAIFYIVLLPDRLEVILAIPGQPLRNYKTAVSQQQVERLILNSLPILTNPSRKPNLAIFKQLHNWLITPIESELSQHQIETLVFVQDGLLRRLPMATLYDGEQYLAQKYRLAIAPSLALIDPQKLAQQKRGIILGGLSQKIPEFPDLSALPGVEVELTNIQQKVPNNEVLLNQTFTQNNLEKTVNQSTYSIVHLATHGQFSSQAEDTFILAYDGKVNINELNQLLRTDSQQNTPIELLVLSACKTAVGDKRAALGLAGVAVKAGARSTLASLWYVSDEATSLLMSNFYQELVNNQISKSEAFRRAQLSLLDNEKFSHPYYWSAFVLVGNWL